MNVLWDTNVISYWLGDVAEFRHSIAKARADFGRPTFFVSVVTTQELMVWARLNERAQDTFEFLGGHFTALDFNEACALEAARLAAVAGHPLKGKAGTKAERRQAVASWQRDAAIAATAERHGMDVLFTANTRDFAPFEPHVKFVLRGVR